MWPFRRPIRAGSSNNPASPDQQVALLKATIATCKRISERRVNWLVAAGVVIIFLVGFMIALNRAQLETAMTEWIPSFGPAQPIQGIDAAYEAYQNREYDLAQRLARPLAEQNDGRAQSLLGLIYRFGRGVAPDQSEAMKWFRRGAERGDPVAQLEIGLMSFDGLGVPQDYSEAARWYQLAAAQGNPEAQYNLGILYATGKGVPQDNVLAHMWFNLAAANFRTRVEANRAAGNRDTIATKMSPYELSKAQELAGEWRPKPTNL